MDLKKGVGQYLDSMTDGEGGPTAIQPFANEWVVGSERYPQQDTIDYAKIQERVNNSQPDMLVTASAKIENFLNTFKSIDSVNEAALQWFARQVYYAYRSGEPAIPG